MRFLELKDRKLEEERIQREEQRQQRELEMMRLEEQKRQREEQNQMQQLRLEEQRMLRGEFDQKKWTVEMEINMTDKANRQSPAAKNQVMGRCPEKHNLAECRLKG